MLALWISSFVSSAITDPNPCFLERSQQCVLMKTMELIWQMVLHMGPQTFFAIGWRDRALDGLSTASVGQKLLPRPVASFIESLIHHFDRRWLSSRKDKQLLGKVVKAHSSPTRLARFRSVAWYCGWLGTYTNWVSQG